MKKITYIYDDIKQAAVLLDEIAVVGIHNFRALAEIADILELGELSEDTEVGTIAYKRGQPPYISSAVKRREN